MKTRLTQLLSLPDFPRAGQYDPQWIIANQMGPNALWLTEWLGQAMELRPGMRVLDLGCGRAISSIFLVKEYGVAVWAVDVSVSPTDNWRRCAEAEVADRVLPLQADARSLPFP